MAHPRFYCSTPITAHSRYTLPDDVAHHASRALRLRAGEAIVLFDGHGGEYAATLVFDGSRALADVSGHTPREAELPGDIVLVQGLPGGDKMDWIIEKAVELGVRRIVPVAAQRSIVQLSGARLEKRQVHWQRVAISACEQCGRNRVPDIAPVTSLRDWLAAPFEGERVLCQPDAETSLMALVARDVTAAPGAADPADAPRPRPLALLVGPEGGWSAEEAALGVRAGVTPVRFGSRVLRTETAGMAMLAAISARRGWL